MHENTFGKQLSLQDLALFLCAAILFFSAGFIHRFTDKPGIIFHKQDSAININRNLLKLINLGNKRLIADLLWIQTLLEGDEEHYSKLDLNSWMYHRFMSISDMDPLFYENYLHGGMYLSIVKDDPLGAAELFELGLKYYPSDYKLNYNAGYNFVFELNDNIKGLKYLERIENNPKSPPFFPSLLAKLKFEVYGNYEIAMIFLRNRLSQTSDPYLINKLKQEIYSLKAEHDLNCLNLKQENCSTTDADGVAYLNNNGKWTSIKKFTNYKLKRQKRNR